MTAQENILTRLNQTGQARVPYLPDLTLWHKWHQGRGTLPEAWRGYSLAQVAEALGVSAWIVEHPWRVEHEGITVASEKVQGERIIRYETSAGTLTARWSLGPDGDWWQTEYPIKTLEDLAAAREVVAARKYVVEPGKSADREWANGGAGESAIRNPAIRNHRARTAHAPLLRPAPHDARLGRGADAADGRGPADAAGDAGAA